MSDARPVFRGDTSTLRAPVGAGRPVAGGMDYIAAVCTEVTKDGRPCAARASHDGLCIGHRRQAKAQGKA